MLASQSYQLVVNVDSNDSGGSHSLSYLDSDFPRIAANV
jgi:hypothetical protein